MGVVRFGLFGFKIQIQPGFWLMAVLLLSTTQRDLGYGMALVAIVFGSILAHELGHALVARRTGIDPVITIHAFGGLTSWQSKAPVPRGRAIAIALAGPLMGLVVFGFAVAALRFLPVSKGSQALGVLAHVNGFWSVINLLPVVPFDGGLVLAQLLGPERRSITLHVSLAVGLLVAVLLVLVGLPIVGIMIGFSAIMHFVGMSRATERVRPIDPQEQSRFLSDAQTALERDDANRALHVAESVLKAPNLTTESRRRALEIVAWAAVALGHPERAVSAFEGLSHGQAPVDPLLVSAILELEGQLAQAADYLRRALAMGDQRPQVAASLVRLLLAEKRYAEAALTAIEILDQVPPDEARRVATACREGGRPIPAAELFMALYAETGQLEDLAGALSSYRASSNGDALEAALTVADEQGITSEELLGTQVLAAEPTDEELRQRIIDRLGKVSKELETFVTG